MALLSAAELKRVEKKYAGGVSSAVVVDLFKGKGERFSEATLRKYVQLGLLPKSRRVGTRGRHKGSSGLYPVDVVRLINDIKESLDAGATLEEIKVGRVVLGGEVDALRRVVLQVVDSFGRSIQHQPDKKRKIGFRRQLDKHRRALQKEINGLSRLAGRLGQPRTS
jgi:DNA-binding transcriptional MerR regulator